MTRLCLTSRLIRIKWWVNSFVFKQYIAWGMVIGEIRPFQFRLLRYFRVANFQFLFYSNLYMLTMHSISELIFAGSVFDWHQNRWIYIRDEKWVPITSIIIISRCAADVCSRLLQVHLVFLLSSKGHCSFLVQCPTSKQFFFYNRKFWFGSSSMNGGEYILVMGQWIQIHGKFKLKSNFQNTQIPRTKWKNEKYFVKSTIW